MPIAHARVPVTLSDNGRPAPYPFTAIVGQEEMRRALILATVDSGIGGVLVMGHRGTGKSTAVRALAALLPPIKAVVGCPYGCAPERPAGVCAACTAGKRPTAQSVPVPVVDLPLGATEDRVVGTLDIDQALGAGVKAFEPGLLARANRGFLYNVLLVCITDGRANVPLTTDAPEEGATRRARVGREAHALARRWHAAGWGATVIDTQVSYTSRGEAAMLAKSLGGRYLFLPGAKARDIAAVVTAAANDTRQT